MPNDNVKEQLMKATIKLLTESKSPGRITVRQIASEAEVNLAMINYYFHSKDELIYAAVSKIIEERNNTLKDITVKNIPPKQKLMEYLITMSDIVFEYSDITKPSIPYLLLEGDIEVPYYILPLIKECYNNKKTETECRLAAYQLISTLQLAFYRSDHFLKYSGIDIMNQNQRNQSLQTMVDLLIET